MGAKQEEKKSLGDTAAAFGKFVYNADDGTVFGRGAASWGRLGVFYLFYYAFLAGLFALSINLCMSFLPEDKPYFQTRLQAPGVTLQPKLPSKKELNSDIMYTIGGEGKYVTHLDETLKKYETRDFGPCSESDYGYSAGNPCIFVKVNKIIGWQPYPFLDPKVETGRSDNRGSNSKAPALVDDLKARNATYNPDLMYISCYGLKDEDKANLGEVNYYPADAPGIPVSKFPYPGKPVNQESDDYLPPILAVQFTNVKRNVEINVGCKAYALNILDDARTNSGFMHFEIEIKDE